MLFSLFKILITLCLKESIELINNISFLGYLEIIYKKCPDILLYIISNSSCGLFTLNPKTSTIFCKQNNLFSFVDNSILDISHKELINSSRILILYFIVDSKIISYVINANFVEFL